MHDKTVREVEFLDRDQFATVTDVLRNAARIPQDRIVTAERMQATSAFGLKAVSPLSVGVVGTCFVAMSFDKSMDAAFETAMMPSIESDCGFAVVRIDRVHHNDVITDRIIAGIRSAQFVVAGFCVTARWRVLRGWLRAGAGPSSRVDV